MVTLWCVPALSRCSSYTPWAVRVSPGFRAGRCRYSSPSYSYVNRYYVQYSTSFGFSQMSDTPTHTQHAPSQASISHVHVSMSGSPPVDCCWLRRVSVCAPRAAHNAPCVERNPRPDWYEIEQRKRERELGASPTAISVECCCIVISVRASCRHDSKLDRLAKHHAHLARAGQPAAWGQVQLVSHVLASCSF